jgi:hypothetical protein
MEWAWYRLVCILSSITHALSGYVRESGFTELISGKITFYGTGTDTWTRQSITPLSVVCCKLVVSAMGWSFVQRSPTDCGVSDCDLENFKIRPRPNRDVEPREKNVRKACVCLRKYSITLSDVTKSMHLWRVTQSHYRPGQALRVSGV